MCRQLAGQKRPGVGWGQCARQMAVVQRCRHMFGGSLLGGPPRKVGTQPPTTRCPTPTMHHPLHLSSACSYAAGEPSVVQEMTEVDAFGQMSGVALRVSGKVGLGQGGALRVSGGQMNGVALGVALGRQRSGVALRVSGKARWVCRAGERGCCALYCSSTSELAGAGVSRLGTASVCAPCKHGQHGQCCYGPVRCTRFFYAPASSHSHLLLPLLLPIPSRRWWSSTPTCLVLTWPPCTALCWASAAQVRERSWWQGGRPLA